MSVRKQTKRADGQDAGQRPAVSSSKALAKLSSATRMLAEIRTAADAKHAMDLASAAKHYAQKAKLGQEAVDHANSIRLQAETHMGRFLLAMDKAKGGRPGKKTSAAVEEVSAATIPDLGLTHKESSEAQFLAVLAEDDPDEYGEIIASNKTVSEVRREKTRAEKLSRIPELPKGKFRVFYADPPWKYGDTLAGTLDESYGGAEKHYPAMSISDLCALPIQERALDDAVLFLWVTSPMLFECAPVIKAWGFGYRASFIWDKVRHNMGHYNSVRHEFLLVCVRGSCTPENVKLFDSVQTIERTAKHSQKPEPFRRIIETLYPRGRKLEVFARQSTSGWETYGNEC